MHSSETQPVAICLTLTQAIGNSRTVEDIYAIALRSLAAGLGVERASILLFDADKVMRFKAYRGLSAAYCQAVEGHTPWTPDSENPEPIVVPDVTREPSLDAYLPTIQAEGIGAMAFIPLVSLGRVIGKFMLYYPSPHTLSDNEVQLASLIAAQVAFAVQRTRTEAQARRSEERLRYALDAASMGTWDWNLLTNTVTWSENLERIHGLPAHTFDGTFGSYEREIHPDDRERVLNAARRAITEGLPYDVEYRIVAPDGTVRWCEGKGRVEWSDGLPTSMSGICMMVTRRKEAELARLAAAEEASRQKDDFLATLSHELRTPLNAIVGWVHLLQTGNLQDDRRRQAIDVIGRNARLQTQLIEDILDVSRIISGKLDIERGPVAVEALLDTVMNGTAPAAASKGIGIETSLCDNLPTIDGDARRLHQIIGNVLSNAIKFTPDGGRVLLRCTVDTEWLTVEVTDTGVGISADFLPHVFDRFRQADSRAARPHGGLGLGLAIARHLVEEHGGDIRATSPGLDQGTTVTIRLPISPDVSVLPTSVPSPPAVEIDLHSLIGLVVDDQEDSRNFVATLLEQRGATVLRCDSAAAALDVAMAQPFDVVITDIGLPDVDGYELIRRLRAAGCNVPAIAVTAYARPEDRSLALDAGFTAYCVKPLDGTDLLIALRNVLQLA